jgi:enolase
MRIENIDVREISDSRGDKTIEVEITSNGDKFQAKIPSGKSRGRREAAVLKFSDIQRVLDNGLKKEILQIETDFTEELDRFLIKYDGTPTKSHIGGNLSLGISLSFARALGKSQNKELWEILRSEYFGEINDVTLPAIFSNMINCGVHADTNLSIQEYIVIGRGGASTGQLVENLKSFYQKLGSKLKDKSGLGSLPLGDEKGYAIDFENNFGPIEMLEGLIKNMKFEEKWSIGLDAAASNFQRDGKYFFEGRALMREELERVYIDYFRKSSLLTSIEDPFGENDKEGFRAIKERLGDDKIIVGDDLTVTDPNEIGKCAKAGLIGGVIIKPNQIGTVSETCTALRVARENNLYRIVSHRSGEVDDNFLVHFAKASGAEAVKIGAPAGERLNKFEELIKLYD